MKYSRNSLLLTAGLFAISAAIVFHAWWPSYKADRDRENWVEPCAVVMGLLGDADTLDSAIATYEGQCTEKYCEIFGCRTPH